MADTVSKTIIKAKALDYFRTIEQTGTPLIVTDHGKPVIEIRRYRSDTRAPLDILCGSVLRFDSGDGAGSAA